MQVETSPAGIGPDLPRLPVGDAFDEGVAWLTDNAQPFFTGIQKVVQSAVDGLLDLLSWPPALAVVAVLALLAFLVRGWRFAVFSLLALSLVVSMHQWDNAMSSLSLILVASLISILVAIPLGILAARSDAASRVIRPVLDFMQTMPAFVYLIPAVTFFSIGVVPGVIATVIFSMPPGVRLTELGIRGVDAELVEAGYAFGATPRSVLGGIQIPLAMRSIMAGVNQVIMLALSMVVIAGMVGAGGLGGAVFEAITRLDMALGFEAGLAVVIVAIYLDRLTGALGAIVSPTRSQ